MFSLTFGGDGGFSSMRHTRVCAVALSALVLFLALPMHAPAAAPSAGALVSWTPLDPVLWPSGTAAGFKLTYATQDARAREALSTGEVFLPIGQAPSGGWPVISWAHGTQGLDDSCAPSVMGPILRDVDLRYLANWLNEGYAVVATDYAGLGTPGLPAYIHGRSEAHNIVDMVKAARAFAEMNLRADQQLARKWVAVGQSQGAGAAIYAARYASEFGGAELDYRGAVGTGTPALIEKLLLVVGPKSPPVPLAPAIQAYVSYIFASLRDVHPELGLDAILTETGREALQLAERQCIHELEESLKNTSLGDYFTRPLATMPGFRSTIDAYMAMPESGYHEPFFMGHGLVDTDVPFPLNAAYAGILEINRQPLTYKVYPADHFDTLFAAEADTHPFVRRLFAAP